MKGSVVGLGNALADILTSIESDSILDQLTFERGTMNLVDNDVHRRITDLTRDSERSVVSGGSAANTVRGLAQLGVDCSYIGKIGPDDIGEFMEKQFHVLGVKPQLIRSKTPTGRCMVMISPDGERTMATYLGAAVELTREEIRGEHLEDYRILHIEGYLVQNHDLIHGAVALAKKQGLTVSLDMASYNIVAENLDFMGKLLDGYVDIVFANEEEARTFTGKEPREAAEILGRMCDIAVVKVGEKGSYIVREGELTQVEAYPARPVDTTGAGDLYATGFLYGLCNGLPLAKCGEIGSLVASKVIEEVGPAIKPETWTEIRERIAVI